jgi:hypothetical protein
MPKTCISYSFWVLVKRELSLMEEKWRYEKGPFIHNNYPSLLDIL